MAQLATVGAGFSGAVIAHVLAKAGHRVDVFDSRSHVAGNCHTERDLETGILIHRYGPHIFHTSNPAVWQFIQQFDTFMPFINRVKAYAGGAVYSLPINLLTINQLFGTQLSPRAAETYLDSLLDRSVENPQSFEEQALSMVGRTMYETFLRGYTKKQWGVDPTLLPASILKRLPLRFNYDDNYYSSVYQGIPLHGYSFIVEQLLDHPNIHVYLNTCCDRLVTRQYRHVFYSGSLDAWFSHDADRLGYRTLDFETLIEDGDFQGNAVINYCDEAVPWTRCVEHKHFAPWESHERTIVYREYSRQCGIGDIPYYPMRLIDDKTLLSHYVHRAAKESGVSFVGRLGTYRYLDMHLIIAEALQVAERYMNTLKNNERMPAFIVNPLAS